MPFGVREIEGVVNVKVIGNDNLDYMSQITEYGVREVAGQSSPTLERVKRVGNDLTVGEATNLVANVGVDNIPVLNSFDNIPIFNRVIEVIEGNTFVKVNKFYIKEESVVDGDITYDYLWMCATKLPGYRTPLSFVKEDGSENDFYYIGAYEGYIDDGGKLRSIPNVFPTVSTSRNDFRDAARKNDGDGTNVDSKYQITDIAEYVDLVQIPMMIEFATKNMQSVMNGFTSGQYNDSHIALVQENATNRVIISNSYAESYRIGQTIDVGTSRGGRQVARDRIILDIHPDTPINGQSAIVFDGEPVDINSGNNVYNVSWKTGTTDGVVASSGCYTANGGKYSIVWRGIENPYGNIYKHIDGGKIVDHQMWVCQFPSGYDDKPSVDGKYEYPYMPLSYTNSADNGYTKKMGFDKRFPHAKFPVEVGAGSATYYSDYYYQNSGDRTIFVGGYWSNGSFAGPFYWDLDRGLGYASFRRGARLSYRP